MTQDAINCSPSCAAFSARLACPSMLSMRASQTPAGSRLLSSAGTPSSSAIGSNWVIVSPMRSSQRLYMRMRRSFRRALNCPERHAAALVLKAASRFRRCASYGGFASITDSLVKQPGGQASALREMFGTRPPSVLSASKAIEEGEAPQSAGAEPPHPVATLRSGQSLHRKGLPAHDAGRRALRRSTTVFRETLPHYLGPSFAARFATGYRRSSWLPAHGS